MTNEEKSKKIAEKLVDGECAHAAKMSAIEMAKWKDQQFKELLEKKKEELFNSNCWSVEPYIALVDEIINELFPEQQEQDSSDNDE